MTTATKPFPVEFDDAAAYRAALEAHDAAEAAADEMDAPSDWDSGVVTFDPYL